MFKPRGGRKERRKNKGTGWGKVVGDGSPLGRGTGRERSYYEKSDPKPDLFSEKEQRENRGR